jgi:hypothetical protein
MKFVDVVKIAIKKARTEQSYIVSCGIGTARLGIKYLKWTYRIAAGSIKIHHDRNHRLARRSDRKKDKTEIIWNIVPLWLSMATVVQEG